ncbi:hypothetical protein ZTR_04562 [Talaromyces verruculosus]|nr:hypothetical protein ZTR_04562 [Talaromyces verruculosus]
MLKHHQFRLAYILVLILGFAGLLSATPIFCNTTSIISTRLVHQFPNHTWVENILTLNTGHVIVTVLNKAQVVVIDPNNSKAAPQVAAQLVSSTAVLGIAQLDPFTIAVAGGNMTYPEMEVTPGSFGVQIFDIIANDDNRISLTPRKWIPIPGASELDGMTSLPGNSENLLIADPTLGVIWNLNLRDGTAINAFNNSLSLGHIPNTTTSAVNGVHAQNGFVYFTNSDRASFGRIPITTGGFPVSMNLGAEILATDSTGNTYDDFALGDGERFFICSTTDDSIKLTLLNGTQCIIAGGPTHVTFDHPVSAMLGKTSADDTTLYVTTAGIIAGVGGLGGGQVWAIDHVTG